MCTISGHFYKFHLCLRELINKIKKYTAGILYNILVISLNWQAVIKLIKMDVLGFLTSLQVAHSPLMGKTQGLPVAVWLRWTVRISRNP